MMSGAVSLLLGVFTFVELNCENLFDVTHDTLKQDTEYTPQSLRHWTKSRYWQKLNNTAREILSCSHEAEGKTSLPDLIALCEVENDSVVHYLTRRSLLRNARYESIVTQSPDLRGIDVALLYSPWSFRLINTHPLRVDPLEGMRPTRDILYASGEVMSGDTLHVFVVHAPSRFGGRQVTEPYRMAVAERLLQAVDSVRATCREPRIIVAGDFNDASTDRPLMLLGGAALEDITPGAVSLHGTAKGTYKYQGRWESIDHVLVSPALLPLVRQCVINDQPFLMEEDRKFGGKKPFRTYNGYHYLGGYSDHLPLIVRFDF